MRRLTRWLIRLYPRAWRDRYEEEILELVASRRVTAADLLGLATNVVAERVRRMAAFARSERCADWILGLVAAFVVFALTTTALFWSKPADVALADHATRWTMRLLAGALIGPAVVRRWRSWRIARSKR